MPFNENKLPFILWVRFAFLAMLAHVSLPLFSGYAITLSPFEAFALVSGAYFSHKRIMMCGIILLPIWMSDIGINYIYLGQWTLFYPGFYWQYLSFSLIALIGFTLKNHITLFRVGAFSLLSAILFFMISNFGVWIQGLWYPLTQEGLMKCYVAAIPFFHYSLLGNLFYSAILFGSLHWIQQKQLNANPATIE